MYIYAVFMHFYAVFMHIYAVFMHFYAVFMHKFKLFCSCLGLMSCFLCHGGMISSTGDQLCSGRQIVESRSSLDQF